MDNGDYKKYKSEHVEIGVLKLNPSTEGSQPKDIEQWEWVVLIISIGLAAYAVYRIVRKNFYPPQKDPNDF